MEREIDQWKLKEAHERMAKLETRLEKLEAPMSWRASEVVDLTCEEDEGGVGSPIILADETPAPGSVVPPLEGWTLNSKDERVLAGLLMGIMSEKEWRTDWDYTPTGPCSLDFNWSILSRFSPFHSFSSKFEAPKHSFKS